MEWRAHIARFGGQWFSGELWVRITFLVLFALAALLRFWNLPNLPFTHDELSALVRIYPTLGETIQRGVIELDTHPPGVQVFEWIWTKVFGTGEAIVKFPFIALALLALFFLYRFALAWSSAPVALITTALLATLQYTVLYAQIARPYAIGFFTTALLADQLTRYLAHNTRRTLIGTGIAVVLSAYTHHFALLLAAIMVVTGFFLLRPEQRKAYSILCAACLLVYLPNLPIFLKQLSLGGLDGWLPPPDSAWISNYIAWIFHFSMVFGGAFGLLVIAALILRMRRSAPADPSRWFLLVWGLLPLAIGYGYSIWRSPVLQYSLVLFSFPYIIIALLSGLRALDRNWTVIACTVIAGLGTFTLIHDRQHYTIFQGSRYEAMVQAGFATIQEFGTDGSLVLFDAPDPQIEFYMRKHGLTRGEVPYVQLRGTNDPGALDSLLSRAEGKVVLLGLSNGYEPEDIARVQARFPNLLDRADHVEGRVYRFTDLGSEAPNAERTFMASLTGQEQPGVSVDIHSDLPTYLNERTGEQGWLFADREFGLALEVSLGSLGTKQKDEFEVVLELDSVASTSAIHVVVELRKDDSTFVYRSSSVLPYGPEARVAPIPLVTVASPEWIPNVHLKTYAFDPSKSLAKIKDLHVWQRKHNPIQNALFEPLERSH